MALLRVPEKTAGMALPEYHRQLSYTAGTGRTARADDAFVRRLGRADAVRSRSLARLAGSSGKALLTAVHEEEDFQAAKAAGAYNLFQNSMKEKLYGEEGILRREGEAAFSSAEETEEAVRDSMDEAAEAGELDAYARSLLAKQVFAYREGVVPKARQHALQQRALWLDSQNQRGMELAREGFLSSADDREERMLYLNDMQNNHRRMAARHGLNAEEEAADWEKLRARLYDELSRSSPA